MALYHKWDVKNDFAYVLQFFSLIFLVFEKTKLNTVNRDYDIILGLNVTLCLPLKESLNYFKEEAIPGHNDYG